MLGLLSFEVSCLNSQLVERKTNGIVAKVVTTGKCTLSGPGLRLPGYEKI
jgi:hypothetical protein